jgi:trk system potassium uptake protein TrkA
MLRSDGRYGLTDPSKREWSYLVYENRVAVLGLGRFGSAVAVNLAARGEVVLGIDCDRAVVSLLIGCLHRAEVADATDLDALRRLGLSQVGTAVVAIGRDVVASSLTASLLAELQVPEIWARAGTTRHAKILERVGAHRVVMPQQDMGRVLAGLLSSGPMA